MTSQRGNRLRFSAVFFSALISFATFGSERIRANELEVRAPVTRVEPIMAEGSRVEHCSPRPGTDSGIASMLRWDLGLACEVDYLPATDVTGYKVYYTWDKRSYSRVMAHNPGASVALRIRLD